jgi:hypothetical protein
MKKPIIGSVVYYKKSAITKYDPCETPHIVIGYMRKKSGLIATVLDDGSTVHCGELTDTPCSQMVCGQCKYHGATK